MQLQPFYIIPHLIKQPTWGGQYIAQSKNILNPAVRDEKIGQSYELSTKSRVSTDPAAMECFVVSDSGLNDAQQYGSLFETYDLQSIVTMDPVGVLGAEWAEIDSSLSLLIKFNQAKNNSYQVHVRPGQEFNGWQAKPETWYYLEEGKATLGIRNGAHLPQYKRTCQEIDKLAHELSHRVRDGSLTIEAARGALAELINQQHPRDFVNTVKIPRGAIVDLWQGGIHHSWEADATTPNGNIIYEIQLNAKDERSTIRSFDQGNIKDNGDVRPLHVEDYFLALNTSPIENNPDTLVSQPQGHTVSELHTTELSSTPYYELQRLEFIQGGSVTRTTASFHHLFVHDGEVTVEWHDKTFALSRGRSLFVPAKCEQYVLSSASGATILQTSLPASDQSETNSRL